MNLKLSKVVHHELRKKAKAEGCTIQRKLVELVRQYVGYPT